MPTHRGTVPGQRSFQDSGATYEEHRSHVGFNQPRFSSNDARHDGGAIYVLGRASQLKAAVASVGYGRSLGSTVKEGASIYTPDEST